MPPVRRLVTAGILIFLAGIIILFPARVGYQWFAPPGVALSSIEGSVWRGSARDASAAGVYLRDLSWRIRPTRLLTGKLAYAITVSPTGGFINADVSVSAGGAVTLTNLQASIPLAALEQAIRVRGLRGMANAQFERLRIEAGMPVAAEGVVEVASLLMPLVAPVPIGGYKAEFFTQQEGIVASVEDTDGAVDLAGRLTLGADRSYQFLGQLAPKPTTPESLRQQMQFLGSANDRGQYELRLEGTL